MGKFAFGSLGVTLFVVGILMILLVRKNGKTIELVEKYAPWFVGFVKFLAKKLGLDHLENFCWVSIIAGPALSVFTIHWYVLVATVVILIVIKLLSIFLPEKEESTFNLIEYHVDLEIISGSGSVSPFDEGPRITLPEGKDQKFYFMPDDGYKVLEVTVDDETVKIHGDTYQISKIAGDHSMKVHFCLEDER